VRFTAEVALFVTIWNLYPVERMNSPDKYSAVCCPAGSVRIFVRAYAGAPGTGWPPHKVNTPGNVCICCGKGTSDGAAIKAAADKREKITPEIWLRIATTPRSLFDFAGKCKTFLSRSKLYLFFTGLTGHRAREFIFWGSIGFGRARKWLRVIG
jgi:hypothetical protein